MTESTLLREVLLSCGHGATRLMRNMVGGAWLGQLVRRTPDHVVLKRPVQVRFGLAVGSADLIGWHAYTIQAEDVGRTVGVIVSLETKAPRGAMRAGQAEWRDAVARAGGIAAVVRSADEARAAIDTYRPVAPHTHSPAGRAAHEAGRPDGGKPVPRGASTPPGDPSA